MSAAEVVSALSRVMRAHGGGLVLETDGPAAQVRYTGMCAACAGRLLCHENLVRPALEAAGAVSVEAPGTRADISVLERMAALYGRQETHDDHDNGGALGTGRRLAD